MLLTYQELTIRSATEDDGPLLAQWWNDGAVMAHAGFPNGLGVTPEEVAQARRADSDDTQRVLILERGGTPIGEMNYKNYGSHTAGIGIKLCDPTQRERGYGRLYLSMLLGQLFSMGYQKIALDTNLKNTRAQHVYALLGFSKVRVNQNAWTDQLGNPQSVVDYVLYPQQFVDYTKVDRL